jgi:hypothetical protein
MSKIDYVKIREMLEQSPRYWFKGIETEEFPLYAKIIQQLLDRCVKLEDVAEVAKEVSQGWHVLPFCRERGGEFTSLRTEYWREYDYIEMQDLDMVLKKLED